MNRYLAHKLFEYSGIPEWVKIKDYANEMNCTVQSLYITKMNYKNEPFFDSIFKIVNKNTLMINKDYMTKYIKFVNDIYDEAQSLYYELLNIFGRQYTLSSELSKISDKTKGAWNMFFDKGLFYMARNNKTVPVIGNNVILFLKHGKQLKEKHGICNS